MRQTFLAPSTHGTMPTIYLGGVRLAIVLFCCWCVHHVRAGDSSQKSQQFSDSVWEQDLGDSFNIDASVDNLQKVNLRCGADSMHVQLETVDDFTGVMYTRGSFHKQSGPCFIKPKGGRAVRSLRMKFGLDDCLTSQKDDIYSNVVVVQHDPDLVTPGDAAFALECDFSSPRDQQVHADYQARDRLASASSITLVSPDPNTKSNSRVYDTIHNRSQTVTFTPNTIRTKILEGTAEEVDVRQPKRKHSMNEL